MTDAELVRRFAARRDEAAFEALIARHGPMVLGVCRQLLRNPADADDAFQATFLVLVRKAGTVSVRGSLASWLYGVAYKVAARARAGLALRQRHETRRAAMTPTTEREPRSGWRELVPVVHEELNRLPGKYRAPLVLCYLEGLTHDEAAQRLGWPLGTVKGRLARGRDLLRTRMARRGITASAGLVLALLAPESAPAAVPEALASATLRAAVHAGAATSAGATAAGVASTLADAVVRGIMLAKVKVALGVALALGAASAAIDLPPLVPPAAQAEVTAAPAEERPDEVALAPPAVVGARPAAAAAEPAAPRLPAPGAESAMAGPSALRAAYAAGRARAGRDPAAHVRLALWCEAHGLEAERLKHLAIALVHDPANARARGLLGLVAWDGRWQRPEAIAEREGSDAGQAALAAAYNARRARTPSTPAAQWKLGLWCEQAGLGAEALAHFAAVTRLDPNHEAAWKRLGCRRWAGRWLTDAQIAAERAQADAQRVATYRWRGRLELWRGWLGDRDRNTNARARALVAGLTDPRAVPAVWATFGQGNEAQQILAAQILGQIDAPSASRALANLAILGRSAEVRRVATETLLHRDPREFVPAAIGLMLDAVKYEVRPVRGPGSIGVLFVEGQRFNVQRLYTPPPLPALPLAAGGSWELDETGMPVFWVNSGHVSMIQPLASFFLGMLPRANWLPQVAAETMGPNSALQTLAFFDALYARYVVDWRFTPDGTRQVKIPVGGMVHEIQKSARSSQQQLASDIRAIDQHNALVEKRNEPVAQLLSHFASQRVAGFRDDWQRWWNEERGYAYDPRPAARPTVTETVEPAYRPQPVQGFLFDPVAGYAPAERCSCFGAGTLVCTRTGMQPIELLRVGDQVLTQDAATGALSFEPIIAVFHNPPKPVLRITAGHDTILATGIHRFWLAGKGWTMARDLKEGDALRTLDGLARVESVEPAPVQPVFNLEVARHSSFLVGGHRALVHDNTLVEPVLQAFDAPGETKTAPETAAAE